MYQSIQRHESQAPTRAAASVQRRSKGGAGLDYSAGIQALVPANQPGYDVQRKALSPHVQLKGGGAPVGVQQAAAQGVSGSGGRLPFLSTIQKSFGQHDVSSVSAHVGGGAAEACKSIGAEAYASGNSVAFGASPSLHTAAHEAAHVVQQRAGVSLSGGVGKVGDKYEQHADGVADLVVQGQSAEGLLDRMAGRGGTGAQAVQRKESGEKEESGEQGQSGPETALKGVKAGRSLQSMAKGIQGAARVVALIGLAIQQQRQAATAPKKPRPHRKSPGQKPNRKKGNKKKSPKANAGRHTKAKMNRFAEGRKRVTHKKEAKNKLKSKRASLDPKTTSRGAKAIHGGSALLSFWSAWNNVVDAAAKWEKGDTQQAIASGAAATGDTMVAASAVSAAAGWTGKLGTAVKGLGPWGLALSTGARGFERYAKENAGRTPIDDVVKGFEEDGVLEASLNTVIVSTKTFYHGVVGTGEDLFGLVQVMNSWCFLGCLEDDPNRPGTTLAGQTGAEVTESDETDEELAVPEDPDAVGGVGEDGTLGGLTGAEGPG